MIFVVVFFQQFGKNIGKTGTCTAIMGSLFFFVIVSTGFNIIVEI